MTEFRDKLKTMLSDRCMELAQNDEDHAELVKLMHETNCGPELVALVQAGKDHTSEQVEAVIKTLGF